VWGTVFTGLSLSRDMAEYDPVESPDASTVFPYHDLTPPAPADLYRARGTVREHLPRTPLVRSETLSAELDADVYLKREDTLPTGAFKIRGGVWLVSRLDAEFRERGLIAASTGNHGQSVAWAGREFGVPVTVGVPEGANPDKVRAMRSLGADVSHYGADFDEARERVERLAAEEGYRYVHSANEPALVAGVGTAGLEVVEDCPEVDDDAIREAVARLYVDEHVVMEGACGTAVAAALEAGGRLAGKTVVLPVSGRNIDATSHREILRENDYAG